MIASLRTDMPSIEEAAEMSRSVNAVPSGVRILVVDDDARICQHTAATLARIGFQVVTADDGTPAIAQAEVSPPDLAVVDLGMPTDGYAVVARLKELYGAGVHVTILSGNDDEGSRSRAFECGADDYIVKPVGSADLRRRMIAAARSQQAFVETRLARERADRLLAYGAEATALLAHDVNNGLSVAVSNLSYLSSVLEEDKPEALGEDERQAVAATLRALRRMSVLVANFVDISRFEDAAVKPLAAPVPVRELLNDVIEVHVTTARGITAEIDCDRDLIGLFDSSLVERVLHNIVGNASRYCQSGGKLRLSGRQLEGKGVELVVSNTGPAIPPELAANLFGKYSKGLNGKRGIGLYFCRLAVEAHGGTIEHVPLADGPSFVIRLPGR
jgi:signal transduction histidine kinase